MAGGFCSLCKTAGHQTLLSKKNFTPQIRYNQEHLTVKERMIPVKTFQDKICETEKNIEQLISSGVPEDRIISQMEIFDKGFSFASLVRPCTPGDGIDRITENQFDAYLECYTRALNADRLLKFVPASGAATRMFKALLSVFNSDDPLTLETIEGEAAHKVDFKFFLDFVESIEKFAFYHDLSSCLAGKGLNMDALRKKGVFREILAALLEPWGLGYAETPKGLVQFHAYEDHSRTAFEEHIAEAMAQAWDGAGPIPIHYTVSKAHAKAIKEHISKVSHLYQQDGQSRDIGFSTQKKSTNTIAVDMKNRAFRSLEAGLIFRPGGHGALLENLNDLGADIVFVKNIDNVVPDCHRGDTITWKALLCGYLVHLQDQIFHYLGILAENKGVSSDFMEEMIGFARETLHLTLPDPFSDMKTSEKASTLFSLFNRPIRVCGMVKNLGEAGGGPFWARDKKYGCSLQIVESSQVDDEDPIQAEILSSSTHFNPVDLVCGVRDYLGNPFNLSEYADYDSGFITMKSSQGKELKAMELPGLWNGSMAFWTTVFVEVPLSTFNPVKSVNDLLRPEHQVSG